MENHLSRLATFENLPESSSFSPCMASKAGFYYTGEGDTVGCYSCGLRLNNWESGVHPMTAHRELSPDCQFVTQHRDDVSPDQVVSQSAPTSGPSSQLSQSHNHHRRRRRGYNSRQDYYRQLASVAGSLRSPADTSIDRTSNDSSIVSPRLPHSNVDRFTCPFLRNSRAAGNVALVEEPGEQQMLNVASNITNSDGAGQLGIQTARPRHPAMAVEAARLASFDRWPRSSPVSPESLARVGFYSTGVPNEVCCFFCGGRLSRWQQNDDPMAKHRQLYPTCGFVRLMAEAHIERTTDSESSQQFSSAAVLTTPATTAPTTPATTAPTTPATTAPTAPATTAPTTPTTTAPTTPATTAPTAPATTAPTTPATTAPTAVATTAAFIQQRNS
ncbi:E3 ubiquitin-protein ligase XIAP, partial [Lamellibrachia satsuma]